MQFKNLLSFLTSRIIIIYILINLFLIILSKSTILLYLFVIDLDKFLVFHIMMNNCHPRFYSKDEDLKYLKNYLIKIIGAYLFPKII